MARLFAFTGGVAPVFTLATFNVNSINARLPALLDWLEQRKPDVVALQETKCEDAKFPLEALSAAGWRAEHFGQKTYNGVALLAREDMHDITRGLDEAPDAQARCIAATVRGVRIVNTYVPQGSEVDSDKFRYKLEFLCRLHDRLKRELASGLPLAWLGDFNIAPEDIDVYAPDFFAGEVGVHQDERAALERIRALGFEDLFRRHHPDQPKQYTFFDYRVRDSVKYRKGWRIDHIWGNASLAARSTGSEIDMCPRMLDAASDHTPLLASFSEAAGPPATCVSRL